MSIYSSMNIAVSGLKGQSYAMGHISGNIANSQTTGFKRTETAFQDMVPSSPYYRQLAGGVEAYSRGTNDVQGDMRDADVPTFMGINGSGFFQVGEQVDVSDGMPVFGETDMFTRRGDFEFDRNGYMVNGSGYYLKGIPVDSQTGNLVGSLPETVRVTNDFLDARETTQITLRGNLASYPMTAQADPDDPGSELLSANSGGDFDAFTGNDADSFLEQSIAGGAITVYDSGGGAHDMQFRWGKTDNADGDGDQWNLFYLEDSSAPTWRNVGEDYEFDDNGQISNGITSVDLGTVEINGATVSDDLVLNHGENGLTQFADPNGVAQATEFRQNGFSSGELEDISISESGRIVGSYTNGRQLDLYEIQLVDFNAPNKLQKLDGGAFRATQESGDPIAGAQGTIVGSALEGSNTDIADEFSKLIVTQQAYSANTRVVSTGGDMLQEVLNMIR